MFSTVTAFGSVLEEGARSVGLELSADVVDRLGRHYALLVRWARRMNLTTVLEAEDAAIRHALDSLLFVTLLPDSVSGVVVDVGSGAGFPGVPIAMMRPSLRLVLLEPTRKRASFLRVVGAELGLSCARVVEGRLDGDRVRGLSGPFAGVVSRATLAPSELLIRAAPHLEPGGFIVTSRGAQAPSVDDLHIPESLSHDARRTYRLPGELTRTLDRFMAAPAGVRSPPKET